MKQKWGGGNDPGREESKHGAVFLKSLSWVTAPWLHQDLLRSVQSLLGLSYSSTGPCPQPLRLPPET